MSDAYATRSRLSPSAVARPSAIHGTGLLDRIAADRAEDN